MNETMILETQRCIIRKLTSMDVPSLCKILQDEEVMVAYEGAFDDAMVQEWLQRQLMRYENDGFGLWAVVLKENKELIGQCGITMQTIENTLVHEVGYLFQKAYWHQGYATETAQACRNYAFDQLGAPAVYSMIRDTNIASKKVAIRNQMVYIKQIVKHYRGISMPHDVYRITKQQYEQMEEKK